MKPVKHLRIESSNIIKTVLPQPPEYQRRTHHDLSNQGIIHPRNIYIQPSRQNFFIHLSREISNPLNVNDLLPECLLLLPYTCHGKQAGLP